MCKKIRAYALLKYFVTFDSVRKERSFRSAQAASTYLNSLMLVKNKDRSSHYRSNCINVPKLTKVHRKATGFGGSYREIIMKKF